MYDQWIISVLEDNEDLTSCDHVVENVTDSVPRITLLSNVMDYKISHGVVDSQIYHYPFKYSISGKLLDVIDSNTSGYGPDRKCTDHK